MRSRFLSRLRESLIRLVRLAVTFLIKLHIVKPYVIVRVDGGICSQMHFYLVGKLFEKRGICVKYDLEWFQESGKDINGNRVRNFDLTKAFPYLSIIEPSISDRVLFRCFKYTNDYKSDTNKMDFLNQKPPLWLLSYYPYTREMLDILMPQNFYLTDGVLDINSDRVYKQIKEKKDSVAVHVRRGDLSKYNSAYGNPVPNSYFAHSIDHFRQTMETPFFFFFSDEMDWVENCLISELCLDGNYMLVKGNSDDKGYMDLFLISACSSQITSKGSLGKYGGLIHHGSDNTIVIYDDVFERRKWDGLSSKFLFIQ